MKSTYYIILFLSLHIINANASDNLIGVYQKFISPINQSTCQSYPSCSKYGKLSIKKHGFYGVLLTADRLNRCGHDTHKSNKIIVGQSIKNYDPVP